MSHLVKHAILFKKTGENATTPPDATRLWAGPGSIDLTKTGTFCVSFDNDMLVTELLYSVSWVALPHWLSFAEFLGNETAWKWTWGFGVDAEWPESWQRGLNNPRIKGANLLACVTLLKTQNFRSDFRQSMRDRLVEWLETPAENRQYDSPFSPRQFECLLGKFDWLTAKRLDENLYRARGACGLPVPKGMSWNDIPTHPDSAQALPEVVKAELPAPMWA